MKRVADQKVAKTAQECKTLHCCDVSCKCHVVWVVVSGLHFPFTWVICVFHRMEVKMRLQCGCSWKQTPPPGRVCRQRRRWTPWTESRRGRQNLSCWKLKVQKQTLPIIACWDDTSGKIRIFVMWSNPVLLGLTPSDHCERGHLGKWLETVDLPGCYWHLPLFPWLQFYITFTVFDILVETWNQFELIDVCNTDFLDSWVTEKKLTFKLTTHSCDVTFS